MGAELALGEAPRARHGAAIAGGLVVGAATTWNVSNVGAVADPLAEAYGVSLAAIGLLTTALFVTHLAVQIPGGRLIDRVGARRIALLALAVTAGGNAICLTSADLGVGLTGRALAGLGTGAGFVAGVDLVRAGRGGPVWQGAYGGATMAGGGLAVMVVPLLVGTLGWRAPYWSALVLAVASVPVVLAGGAVRSDPHDGLRARVLGDRRLLPLGLLQAATFGLSVVAGNWVVALLERHGIGRSAAGAIGGLILFAGIVTRPAGGWVLRHRPAWVLPLVTASLAVGSAAMLALAAGPPLPLAAVASLAAGLAAGFPFAAVFAATQRLRPDAPATAVGFVNSCAVLTILVGTPLAGLAFALPGDGAPAFVAIGALWACALLPLRRTPLARGSEAGQSR
ncbi:MAG TPA: MFS transporter [Gaiellaceae bacterium]|jgi:MFS family permease